MTNESPDAAATLDRVLVSWIRVRMDPSRAAGWVQADPSLTTHQGFRAAWQSAATPGTWVFPWVGSRSFAHVWSDELGPGYRRPSGPANLDAAWERQMPLRWAPDPVVGSALDGVDVEATCLLYPSGSVVILTADVRAPGLTPLEMVTLLARLQRGRELLDGGGVPRSVPALTGDLLDAMDTAVTGAPSPDAITDRVRTIATVTGATGWTGEVTDLAHRTIDALARLDPAALQGATPAPLTSLVLVGSDEYVNLGTTRAALGHGHAVFAPLKAQDPTGAHQLACYHHNLGFSNARTAVLSRTVAWLSGFSASQLSSGGVAGMARAATALLARLYDGTITLHALQGPLWTTRFTEAQVKSAGVLDDLLDVGSKVDLGTVVRLPKADAPAAAAKPAASGAGV